MKKQTKVLATSIATIAMCASLAVGGTFALFTSEDEVNIAVTAGTVKIEATAKDLDQSDLWAGQAAINGGTVSIENMLPGDSVTFKVDVTNYSTVPAHYRTVLTSEDGGLADALTISFDKATTQAPISFLGGYGVDNWKLLEAAAEGGEVVETITVTIAFNAQGDEIDNLYQSKDCSYKVYVEAVQGNAEVIDPIKKDLEETDRNSDTYYIYSEEGMRLMTGIADATPLGSEFFLNFKLMNDLDMTGVPYYPTTRYWVNFDGNGKTIENLTAVHNPNDPIKKAGLFGYAVGVKNVTLKNMNVTGNQAGLLVGSTDGNTLSNITIEGNNSVTWVDSGLGWMDGGIGALVGIAYTTNITDITVADGAKIALNYNKLETQIDYENDELGGRFYTVDPNKTYPTGAVLTNVKVAENAIVKNGDWTYLATNAASLGNGTAKGYNVKMMNDIAFTASATAPYGNKYGIAQNGGVLDGGGYSLTVKSGSDDYAIMTSGGTIKNLNLGNCFRAVVLMKPQSDVVIDNVTIKGDGVVYTINTAEEGAEDAKLIVKNSTIAGWTSFASIDSAEFVNCDFVQSALTKADWGRLVKPYVNTTFTDCRFVEDMYLDCSMFEGDDAIRFTDCEMEDGTAITADNLMVLFNSGVYEKDGVPHNDWKVGGVATADFVPVYVNNVKAVGMTYIADGFYQLEDGSYVVLNADGLRNFAKSVNEGLEGLNEGAAKNYSGETVKLTADIDLENKAWTPIGLNADDAKKFYGTFDGQNHTISNLYINRTEGKYTASGLFGATGGTLKNFTISGAKVNALSGGEATDNGIAVVAGSFYATGTADNVHVKEATVTGNRYMGGIVGYFSGKVTNCSVYNIKLTATPDNLTGSYDNGDKVGGIVGLVNSSGTIENCTVDEATIVGYRDLGGIVGAGYSTTVLNNKVSNSSITVDWTKYYEDKDQNAAEIIGRVLNEGGKVDANNTYNNNVTVNPWTGVMVTAEKLANEEVEFENGKTYHFVHDFPNEVVVTLPAAATITLDGALAMFEKNVKIVCSNGIADGMNDVYPETQPTFGQYTIKNFTVKNSLSIGGLAATILVEGCKVEMMDFSIANADVTLKNNEIIRTVDGGMKRYDGGENKHGIYFYADNYTLTMEGNIVENLINDKNLIVVQGNYPNYQPSEWDYAAKPYRNQITMTNNTFTAKGTVFKVYNDVKYAPVEWPEDYTISTAMKTLAKSLFAGNTSNNKVTCGTGNNDKGEGYSIVEVLCRAGGGKSDLNVTEKNSPTLFE